MTREPLPYTVPVAVGVLHRYGTPDEIRDFISQVEINRDKATAPYDYGPVLADLYIRLEQAEAAVDALDPLAAYYPLAIGRLRVEFDAKTKRAKIRRSFEKTKQAKILGLREKGGRPPDFYNELTANLAEATVRRLEQETGKAAESRQVCEEVARDHHVLFPPGYLDASPRGNIYNAWQNRKKKRRKIVREIEALAPSEEEVELLIRRSCLVIAPGAWRSTPYVRLLEELRYFAESEAALAAFRRKLKGL